MKVNPLKRVHALRGASTFAVFAATLCAAGSLAIFAQDTDLRITKSGNDAAFSWTGGSANYTVTQSNGSPQFQYPQTLAVGLPGPPGSYTYANALTNGVALQFFDVAGSTETSPAGNYTGGATPPPVPTVSSVSPTSGLKVGDTLTVNGSGFSTITTEDVVHFPEGVAVTANASPAPTATSFQITIPRSALSGPMWVQVGNQVSGSKSLVILTQAGFQNLSGVDYQPTTHDIWVADRGWGSSYYTRILQLHFSGTTWGKTEYDNSGSGTWKYQGGQGFDSGQRWYYGVAVSAIGGGARTAITSGSPSASSFMQVKPGSSDYLYVIGAATSPALTNTAFFAYNDSTIGEKHIRKLNCPSPPCTGSGGTVLDTDYGNFGATNLNFNTLAGLALDQNGNLYDTETTQVRKITPSETSSIVATGFSGAMGVAVDQVNTSDPGELLVSDSTANTLYGVDLSVGQKQTVISSMAGHRAASFGVTPLASATCSKLPNTDLAFVLADETTQVRQVPDPRITLVPSGPTRVWISKKRADDAYPTSYQTADHQITITATATTGRTVCFRVVDPPDTAPYGDGTNTGFWCDNKDPGTSNNAGKLWDPTTSTWKDVVCLAVTNGQVSVTLNTTDRYAGDNYIVQATYDDWSTSNTTKALAETGVITAWKRCYIEKDTMFRTGGIIFAPNNTQMIIPAGSTSLKIYKGPSGAQLDNITAGDRIAIFDAQQPYEGQHDEAYAGTIDRTTFTDYAVIPLLQADLSTPYATQYAYTASPMNAASHYPDFSQGQSAGVGVPSTGYYDADLSYMWQTYDDAFVEFWVPPDGAGALPYIAQSWFDWANSSPANLPAMNYFSNIWFKNKHLAPTPPALIPSNYFHLMGASSSSIMYGGTFYLNDWTFVFQGKIEADFTDPSQRQAVTRWVTVHELGHQFDVNPADCSHHDANLAWCESLNHCEAGGTVTAKCLMNVDQSDYAQRIISGVARFCIVDLLTGAQAYSGAVICNTVSEPWNQYDGSIRTDLDPQ